MRKQKRLNLYIKFCLTSILLITCSSLLAKTYFVAPPNANPAGKDSNPGNINAPWATFGKAVGVAVAGDTIYFRGGIYNQTSTIAIPYKNGNSGNPICFFNYPGESPVFDGASFTTSVLKCGLKITFSSYLHFKGLTFRRYGQESNDHFVIGISDQACSNIIYENCTSYEIEGNAFQTNNSDFIYYINCDAYKCADTLRSVQPGNGGCGFSFTGKPSSGSGNISYYGCRAWLASDDGFHGNYEGFVVLNNCWSFSNGYLEGGGSGFKPGYILADIDPLARRLTNCVAAYNKWNGFHENTYEQGRINIEVFNCTSFGNGNGYSIPNSTKWTDNISTYRNNVAYANKYGAISVYGTYTHSNNSWDAVPSISVTDADFISVDATGLSGPRQADGSLPELNFMKLSAGSDLIDAGVNVGLPYQGLAPDIGAFESGSGSVVIPAYVSSAIANATPAVLEMTYNLTLANIVPSASAFSVMVNSAARTVSSVSISGTKVLLTLSSPVAYGNVVTVAYTKPTTNPLQTTSGGQAASITARSVTNNVAAAIPVYVSSTIGNATPSVLEMTYNLTLANIVPSASAFSVMVNSAARTVSSVSISGTKVLLTLSSPVAYGNVVTVAYTKPATNPLQTTSGGQAASITAQPVTNNVAAAIPAYVSSAIANATPSVLEMTYNLTLANIVPSASAFSVMVNSAARTVSSVSISGTKVLLTLSSPVAYGNVVTVAYTKPATNPLQTTSGGQAASITARSVTNNVAAAIPAYVSSAIANATPSVLEMTYNLTLANIVPSASAFSVMVNSAARTVSSVSISGTKVLLTLSSPVAYGNVVTVAYTKPTTNPLQTTSGGQAASITAQPVTNNVAAAIPVYVSSAIANVTPSVLEMTYNLTLANIVPSASAFSVMVNSAARTVSSVSISGTKVLLTLSSPVIYGNIVTVAYTKPATNPLQTTSGGQAASITAQPVTNNVAAAIPVYVSSAIANTTPSVLEMTYNLTLANIVPSASAFSVMVNSAARTVSSVSISGTKVLLTLSSPVAYGNIVTVAYTKPATNPLQTTSGGQAASITARSVTNNVAAAIPVYVSSAIANATPSVLEMTYNLTLANIVPSASAFSVMVNSAARTVSSVSISGTKVLLTLSSPVAYGNVVTVAYTKPTTNPLQTTSGGQAASISAQQVQNNCTPTSNQPPNVSITSPANNSSFKSPGLIVIKADASDIDGNVTKVEFFNGSYKLGEAVLAPYSYTWDNVPVGKYSITAVATDNSSLKAVSKPDTVTVRTRIRTTKGAPVITIIEPYNGEQFVASAKIDIMVDTFDPDTIISKIEYFAGTTKIGESRLPPYSISFESPSTGLVKITSIAFDEFEEILSSSLVDVYVDASFEAISLYPNPNDGHFSVESLSPLQKKGDIINIVNSAGQIVYQGTCENEENTAQFNLSHLDPGIYILIIKNQGILFTKKFIKN
jgi:uncharacterized repeat protein (TIGR02059 family)